MACLQNPGPGDNGGIADDEGLDEQCYNDDNKGSTDGFSGIDKVGGSSN